jgi:uncharacterized protein
MNEPDFEGAKQYAFRRLQNELAPDLYYHSLAHTWDDVLPAAIKLAALSGIKGEEKRLLEVAAAFHDIGFVVQRDEHERVSSEIAAQVLPDFGFSPAQIDSIVGMIMATRLPQTPHNLLEEILADADLDVLGRTEDFFERNHCLRSELAAYGEPITLQQWYQRQLSFLQTHRYLTQAARLIRDPGKQQNIAELKKCLTEKARHP